MAREGTSHSKQCEVASLADVPRKLQCPKATSCRSELEKQSEVLKGLLMDVRLERRRLEDRLLSDSSQYDALEEKSRLESVVQQLADEKAALEVQIISQQAAQSELQAAKVCTFFTVTP
jgi:DNA-binding transcriptional regulator YbjK